MSLAQRSLADCRGYVVISEKRGREGSGDGVGKSDGGEERYSEGKERQRRERTTARGEKSESEEQSETEKGK